MVLAAVLSLLSLVLVSFVSFGSLSSNDTALFFLDDFLELADESTESLLEMEYRISFNHPVPNKFQNMNTLCYPEKAS